MFKAENRVEVNQAESQVMMLDEDFDKSGTYQGVLHPVIASLIKDPAKPTW